MLFRSVAVSAVPWSGPPTSFGSMVAAEVAIYLQAMLLPDADAFSMASSVELRVPFVDSHVFAAALALARDSVHRPGKAVIADLLGDAYLGDLVARPKLGFGMPMRKWMSGPLAPVLKATEDPSAAVWRILDRQAAIRARIVSPTTPDRWANIWVIAALNAWLETTGCCF